MTTDLALIAVVAAGLLGLIVGSFLNVVIHRVPQGRSVVRPRSACPSCGAGITPRDEVPVLSWLLLRGRCRSCRASISARYPLVELANGVLWGAMAWWCLVGSGPAGLLPLLLVLTSACLALALIDLDVHRLPNAIVYPLYPITAVGLVVAWLISGESNVTGALIGAVLWTTVTGVLHVLTRGRGMGLGDVKLSPVLGATVGWVGIGASASGLFASFLLGGAVAVVLLVAGRARRRQAIAFGPFLIAGAAVGLVLGPALAAWYLGAASGAIVA